MTESNEEFDEWVCLIPVRNKTGIIDHMEVSEVDLEFMDQYRWDLDPDGYARGSIAGKTLLAHRVITERAGIVPEKGQVTDHIDGSRTNNMRNNLRALSHADNARNRKKKNSASSAYHGVTFHKRNMTYQCAYKGDIYTYKDELHAAYKYDFMVRAAGDTISKINGVEKPEDFIDYVKRKSPADHTKAKKPIESARQEDGSYLIFCSNKRGEKFSTRVDADDHAVIEQNRYKISHSRGYFNILVDKKIMCLHRWVLKVPSTENRQVDHENRVKSDNRKRNLKLVTSTENNRNKGACVNSSTGVKGVSKAGKRFTAQIGKEYLGTFSTIEEAAAARQAAEVEKWHS